MENDALFWPASLFIVYDESIIYKRCIGESIFFFFGIFFHNFPTNLENGTNMQHFYWIQAHTTCLKTGQ